MEAEQKKLILLVTAIFGGVVIIWLIIWGLYTFLTTAAVQIVTNDPQNVITIQETSPEHQDINIGTVKGNYKTRLHHGTYVVTAKNGYASAQEIFTLRGIGGSKTVNVDINKQANQQGVLDIVSDLGAYSTVADANSIKFIDRNNNPTTLYQINANNALSVIAPGISFTTISWADPSFGVGQVTNGLMTITGTTASTMSTPITPTTFTVAPNHDVYISDGSTLYRGANGTNFTKIYSADSATQITIVSASNNAVLLTSKPKNSVREGDLVVVHKDGSTNKVDGEAYEGAWSPSGNYIAVTGDTSTVFNDKLQKVVDLPSGNVVTPVWLDNDTLAYGDNNLVWQFVVDSHQSTVLATTPNGVGTVSQLALSSDGSTLYISIQNSDISNGYTFYLARYRFHNTATVNPLLQKLSVALPNTPQFGCHVGYVNFTQLAITVNSTASLEQICIDAAKTYLQSYDIDPNAAPIQFIPD